MNKNTFQTVKLEKGEFNIYDFGTVKLHAYKTNDFIDDEVFIVEKMGKAVVIESPCFFENIWELTDYLTQNAVDYSKNGGGKALVDQFTGAFGEIFDHSIHPITNIIGEGKVTIGGIDFNIKQTGEAFDVEIPEIHAVYTHMLGHDCHSIVAGAAHADAMIAELKKYIQKEYDLILTSHYTPEDLKDADTKIAYLENLKAIAADCGSAEEFKAAVQKQYPNYSGENYLDMTAGFFFS